MKKKVVKKETVSGCSRWLKWKASLPVKTMTSCLLCSSLCSLLCHLISESHISFSSKSFLSLPFIYWLLLCLQHGSLSLILSSSPLMRGPITLLNINTVHCIKDTTSVLFIFCFLFFWTTENIWGNLENDTGH